jgi:hypothetical protein
MPPLIGSFLGGSCGSFLNIFEIPEFKKIHLKILAYYYEFKMT